MIKNLYTIYNRNISCISFIKAETSPQAVRKFGKGFEMNNIKNYNFDKKLTENQAHRRLMSHKINLPRNAANSNHNFIAHNNLVIEKENTIRGRDYYGDAFSENMNLVWPRKAVKHTRADNLRL